MIKFSILISLITLILFSRLTAQIITPANEPNKAQQLLIDRGYGMFIHFGINTFADLEWSDGTIPATEYNPTSLDCDQWV